MSVDKARHGEEPFGIDHAQITLALGRTNIRFKCLDLCPADKNIGPFKLGVVVIHCEHARILDEYRHGVVSHSTGPGPRLSRMLPG